MAAGPGAAVPHRGDEGEGLQDAAQGGSTARQPGASLRFSTVLSDDKNVEERRSIGEVGRCRSTQQGGGPIFGSEGPVW